MTPQDFINKFRLPLKGFSNPIAWQDGVGFSLVQEHGNTFASLYKFGLNLASEEQRKPLWVGVSYGKNTSRGISLGSGENGVWDPIDLDFNKDFTYDPTTDKFFKNDKEIDPQQIIHDLERIHKLPTKKIKGFKLRSRLRFWRKIIPGILKFVDLLTRIFLWIVSGETTEPDIFKRSISERLDRPDRPFHGLPETKDASFNESRTLSFFGYSAKRWSVVFYCSIHLIAYTLFFFSDKHWSLLGNIFGNSFLALCYAVVSFTVTEAGIPAILRSFVKFLTRAHGRISFMSLKIKVS